MCPGKRSSFPEPLPYPSSEADGVPYIVLADLVEAQVLGARSSVGAFAPVLRKRMAAGSGSIEIDFKGIQAVSPSALDELLAAMREFSQDRDIQLSNMASGATWKFEAIARAHGRTLVENGPQSWVFKAPVESHA